MGPAVRPAHEAYTAGFAPGVRARAAWPRWRSTRHRRRPPVAPAAARPARLVGVILSSAQALLWDDERGEYVLHRVGDDAFGGRLVELDADHVVVERGEAREVMELTAPPQMRVAGKKAPKRMPAMVISAVPERAASCGGGSGAGGAGRGCAGRRDCAGRSGGVRCRRRASSPGGSARRSVTRPGACSVPPSLRRQSPSAPAPALSLRQRSLRSRPRPSPAPAVRRPRPPRPRPSVAPAVQAPAAPAVA